MRIVLQYCLKYLEHGKRLVKQFKSLLYKSIYLSFASKLHDSTFCTQ